MSELERWHIHVGGIVQGVGFRPFVYTLAQRHGVGGFVLNDSSGVVIEVEGPSSQLHTFLMALRHEHPPLAQINAIHIEPIPPQGTVGFQIVQSTASTQRTTMIAPDTAPCNDCLHELFQPTDRRYHYPFINCTNCGPRFTIIRKIPYDRQYTTMEYFPMCVLCQAEYDDPHNRRFHAQPNACAACGPRLSLLNADGQPIACADPLAATVARLIQGDVLAIKGLGGYHLVCDALNADAVARLRQRKQREARPFALMLPDLDTVRAYTDVSAGEAALLTSIQRPIVLLNQKPPAAQPHPLPPEVAPGYTTLGVMLPYTPLHALLLAAYQAALPAGYPPLLVMTSGNLSDEPIAYRDDDARTRLLPLADAMLTHNRPIHIRCDDSLAQVVAGKVQLLRRARGYVPQPISTAFRFMEPVLATGAHLKNTFCIGREQYAVVSHHIGDLENLETLTSFTEGIDHFKHLFDVQPQMVAYDLHPDYLASRYAHEQPFTRRIGVQHHHAHIASVLAEHGLSERVIGVAADGTGYGTDGTIWGGEIMLADCRNFQRTLHLAHLLLPGGEQAVRQVWRIAAAWLWQVYGDAWQELPIPFTRQPELAQWPTLRQMIERGINTPRTSSMGRLFDAVAALIGLHSRVVYEGQAAIALEMLAAPLPPDDVGYPVAVLAPPNSAPSDLVGILDLAGLLQSIVAELQDGTPAAIIAARFHRSVARLLLHGCRLMREQHGLAVVALSGGVFQNRLLLEQLTALLTADGFLVYTNQRVPPNDGGLSLGQAAVAAAHLIADT